MIKILFGLLPMSFHQIFSVYWGVCMSKPQNLALMYRLLIPVALFSDVWPLQVFALGTNCSGCLGLGDLQSTIEPRRIDVLCGKKIVSLSYGTGPHVAIATAGNPLWTSFSWGEISSGGTGMTSQTTRWFYDDAVSLLPVNMQTFI